MVCTRACATYIPSTLCEESRRVWRQQTKFNGLLFWGLQLFGFFRSLVKVIFCSFAFLPTTYAVSIICTWQINLRFEHPILKFCRIICFFKSRPYPTNFFEAVLPSTLSALILIQQLFQIAQGRFLLTLVHLTMTMSFSRTTHADVRIRPEIEIYNANMFAAQPTCNAQKMFFFAKVLCHDTPAFFHVV